MWQLFPLPAEERQPEKEPFGEGGGPADWPTVTSNRKKRLKTARRGVKPLKKNGLLTQIKTISINCLLVLRFDKPRV